MVGKWAAVIMVAMQARVSYLLLHLLLHLLSLSYLLLHLLSLSYLLLHRPSLRRQQEIKKSGGIHRHANCRKKVARSGDYFRNSIFATVPCLNWNRRMG